MKRSDRDMESSTVVLSVVERQKIGLSAQSGQDQPEKWGWGYALTVMIFASAACWLGLGTIMLL